MFLSIKDIHLEHKLTIISFLRTMSLTLSMVSSNASNEEVVEGVSSPDFFLQLRFVFDPMTVVNY